MGPNPPRRPATPPPLRHNSPQKGRSFFSFSLYFSNTIFHRSCKHFVYQRNYPWHNAPHLRESPYTYLVGYLFNSNHNICNHTCPVIFLTVTDIFRGILLFITIIYLTINYCFINVELSAACLNTYYMNIYLFLFYKRANSVTWNPHKLMGTLLQCSTIHFQENGLLISCNQMSAEYLFMQDKLYDIQYDTGDKVIQCGRHNDVFKLWLQWRAKGNEGFEKHMDHLMELSEYMVEKIKASPDKYYLILEPEMVNVSFWYVPKRLRNIPHSPKRAESLGQVNKSLDIKSKNEYTVNVPSIHSYYFNVIVLIYNLKPLIVMFFKIKSKSVSQTKCNNAFVFQTTFKQCLKNGIRLKRTNQEN
ncbi:hypothetical protein QTP88_018962 [Uroleucon formosanum]